MVWNTDRFRGGDRNTDDLFYYLSLLRRGDKEKIKMIVYNLDRAYQML